MDKIEAIQWIRELLQQAPRSSDEKSKELLHVLRGLEHDARETGLNSKWLEEARRLLEEEE